MNKEVLEKMREMEDLLLSALKSRLKEVSGNYAVTPNTMKAAEILVELFRIEADVNEAPAPVDKWETVDDIHMAEDDPEEMAEKTYPAENKYYILRALEKAIKMTRAGDAVDDLVYDHMHELVIINFRNGYAKHVNIECDSGIAMIRDICNAF